MCYCKRALYQNDIFLSYAVSDGSKLDMTKTDSVQMIKNN